MTRSNVWCTNCTEWFVAEMDLTLNGNHEITCPHCQHVHYRVVRGGEVTEDRWASSGGPVYVATVYTASNVVIRNVTVSSGTTSITDMYASWLSRSDLTLT